MLLGYLPFMSGNLVLFGLAPALRERVPAIDYVDLRFDERVYVRPARDMHAPPAGARTAPVKSGRPTQTG